MTRVFSLILLTGVLTWFVLASCAKGGTYPADNDGPPHVFVPTDTLAPDLTINTPLANQVYSNGAVINISGKLTDDYGLYRGTIKLINDANGVVMVNQAYEIHGLLLYNFNLNHTASVTTSTNYTVTVSFEDHGNNHVTRSVKIKVNP